MTKLCFISANEVVNNDSTLLLIFVVLLIFVSVGVWRIESRSRANTRKISEESKRIDDVENNMKNLPDKLDKKIAHYFERQEELTAKLEARIEKLNDHLLQGK